jgi:hypothetical protein
MSSTETGRFLPAKTVVKSLCGSEANDGVDDYCSVDGGEAIDGRDDHCILFTVITGDQKQQRPAQIKSNVLVTCTWLADVNASVAKMLVLLVPTMQ